ncbi:M13-type metalloendopeptidase [Paenibacillus sp. NPDC058177]|uniref:M13-type metalloendopeptidase n=1 Tax=Paenibacillus sp. NPDC058177 TaxID=3346369 RepID=UPI0036DF7160
MKKLSATILSLSLLTSGLSSVHAAEKALSVSLNGQQIQFSKSAPIVEKGVTLVPVQPLLEKLGVQVKWDAKTRTLSGTKVGLTLSLKVGSTSATVNGKAIKLDAAPKQIQNVTYVPLRFIAETAGYKVAWNQSLRQVSLTSKQQPSNGVAATRLQDDFYEAVNAKWKASTVIPAGKVIIGGLSDLDAVVRKQLLKDITKMSAEGRDKTDDELGNMIKYYKLAADRGTLNKQGYEAIKGDIAKIKSINSLADFSKNQKDLYVRGLSLPFTLDILSDMKDATRTILYINSPKPKFEKSMYTPDNPQGQAMVGLYKNMLADLLVSVGETKEAAERIAGEAVAFEAEFAQYTMTAEDQSNVESFYTPKTLKELKAYSKNIDLEQFIVDVTGKTPEKVSLMKMDYFNNLDKFINEKNWEKIKSWTYATFVLNSATLLSDEMIAKSTQLSRGAAGQEQTAVTDDTIYDIVNANFKEVAGQYYGKTYLGEQAKQDISKMADNMIGVYKNKFLKNDWMSEQTKKEAIKKLDHLKVHIGYPDKLDEMYDSLKVDAGKTLYENNQAIQAVFTKSKFAKIDQLIDRNEWRIAANTANMISEPLTNTITFPAAALQAPFYDKNQSASQNYGAIGAVIGHEISHTFDSNGSKFDGIGNRTNWWTAEDFKKFEAKTKAVVDQYNKLEYLGQKINGQRTLPENIADIAGLQVALEAAKQLPDANLEEFYKSWATVWRQKVVPEIEPLLLAIDPNPPVKFRVNVVVGNTDDFYSTFGVKKGDAMYIAPEDRITLW